MGSVEYVELTIKGKKKNHNFILGGEESSCCVAPWFFNHDC